MSEELPCRALEKYLRQDGLLRSSVPSALTKAFIECYIEFEESREMLKNRGRGGSSVSEALERYVSLFSREASKRIYKAYRCSNIKDLLIAAHDHIARIINQYRDTGFGAVFVARLKGRLLIHMRSPYMPLEIGMAWDPYMNLPHIPSTSIKGLVRSYFKKNQIGIGGYGYEDLFGTKDSEGILIFHDAYPVECGNKRESLLELDIMAPHYKEVENRISEVDANPTPIVFLTVAPGTVFHIPVIITEIDSRYIGDLLGRIEKALEEGIGAKTALGYGGIKVVRKQVS